MVAPLAYALPGEHQEVMKMERTLNHKKNESATAIDLIVLTNGRAGSPSAIFSSILRPAGLTPQEAI